MKTYKGSTEGPVPVIRMYGVTGDGRSVLALVHGFTPYFYASFPHSIDLNESNLGQLRNSLDARVHSFLQNLYQNNYKLKILHYR